MCYQITELYSGCRCLSYQHALDRCASYGRPGHSIQKRTVLVGYACKAHSLSHGSYTYRPSRSSETPSASHSGLHQNSVGTASGKSSQRNKATSSKQVPQDLPVAHAAPVIKDLGENTSTKASLSIVTNDDVESTKEDANGSQAGVQKESQNQL